ncbi:TetR/AcrR family transcriptional regulator [Homoserinimonas sp. A520]
MARVSSADRRAALVQAALRVIDRDGVHAASTRAIVAEAGMPLASFHYAFRSRDELIREVVASVVEGEKAAAVDSLEPGADLGTTVRAGLQAYFDLVVARPAHEQAMFELFHYSLRTDDLADLPRAQYASYHATVREVLEVGAQLTGMRWAIPVDDVARLVVVFTDGVTLAWLADRDADAASRTLDLAATAITALAVPDRKETP